MNSFYRLVFLFILMTVSNSLNSQSVRNYNNNIDNVDIIVPEVIRDNDKKEKKEYTPTEKYLNTDIKLPYTDVNESKSEINSISNKDWLERENKIISKSQSTIEFSNWIKLCEKLYDDNDRVWKDDYRSSYKQIFYKVKCKSWYKSENRGWFAGKLTDKERMEHIKKINADIENFKAICMSPHAYRGMDREYCRKLNFPVWNSDGVLNNEEKLDLIIHQNQKAEAERYARQFFEQKKAEKEAYEKSRPQMQYPDWERMELENRIQKLESQKLGCPGNLDYC